MPDRKVLIIDDEPDFARFVARVATSLNCPVEIVTNASGVAEAYQRFVPDIIVLDIIMPEKDGFEVIKELSQLKCQSHIIISSAYNPHYAEMAELLATARGLLSISVLPKPIAMDDLKRALTSPGSGTERPNSSDD